MSEWVKYTGAEEQLDAMLTSQDGFIVDSSDSVFSRRSRIRFEPSEENKEWLKGLLSNGGVQKYLICEPHPLADMIGQQADTGQPVWVLYPEDSEEVPRSEFAMSSRGPMYKTTTPEWNIPGAEYSFTPFD